MALDPRKFHGMLVTDTCSVWNMLSSRKLFRSACTSHLNFCITPMVLYECLGKPRKTVTLEQTELINRFKAARDGNLFPTQACELDDLLVISRKAPVGLGSGELSCIATAYKLTTIAVMTDERQARLYAEQSLRLIVETTPKLYAWLHYNRHLSDGDHGEVITEHEKYERRPLTKYLNEAYETALQYRLITQ
jgi:predicted nucleic acid-binding protein